ncbi:MAG TPA: hypothetical protein VNQ99_01750 [Xanthobacteraceae bacterium]|nr:hypothetical protein [Xanthobacteraceae bacterium]
MRDDIQLIAQDLLILWALALFPAMEVAAKKVSDSAGTDLPFEVALLEISF